LAWEGGKDTAFEGGERPRLRELYRCPPDVEGPKAVRKLEIGKEKGFVAEEEFSGGGGRERRLIG